MRILNDFTKVQKIHEILLDLLDLQFSKVFYFFGLMIDIKYQVRGKMATFPSIKNNSRGKNHEKLFCSLFKTTMGYHFFSKRELLKYGNNIFV